jgi:Uri superfamily endonuclease
MFVGFVGGVFAYLGSATGRGTKKLGRSLEKQKNVFVYKARPSCELLRRKIHS